MVGFIEKVYVEESQKVKKGEVLVEIDSMELHSNIAALKATMISQRNDLKLAKSIYERNLKLYRVGGLAKEKLDISYVSLQAKESVIENTTQKIAQLEHQLSYLRIVAPFDGEIDTVLLHEGDLAVSSKPILGMSNGKKKLIFAYAPTKERAILKDQRVFRDGKEIGRIKAIYSTSENGLVRAEVALHKVIDLPVGSSLNIEVLTKESKGCIVPDNTLFHKKEGTFVMVYEEGKFTPLKVNVQMREGNRLLVSPCPALPIAQASEVKLSKLPAYDKVEVIGAKDE